MPSGTARHVVIAHRNWVDEPTTTITGTGWMAAPLGLANLRDNKLSRVARSTSLTPSILLDFGPGAPPPTLLVAIPKHNLSDAARWRIRVASSSAFTPATTLYDSRPALGTTGSVTPLAIGTGPATLYVAGNVSFFPNVAVRIAAAPTVYMEGDVVGYDAVTRELVVNVHTAQGAGTFAAWTVTRLAQDVNVWPEVLAFGTGAWGEYTWGGRLLTGDAYQPPGVHLLPLYRDSYQPAYGRYVLIELSDPTNKAGYIDLGRLVVAPGWQPSVNAPPGWEIEAVDPSPRTRARGGQLYVDVRPTYRRLQLDLQHLPRNEIMSNAYELDRMKGVRLPVLAIVDPTDAVNLHRITLYGSLTATTPIKSTDSDGFNKQMTFEEWL